MFICLQDVGAGPPRDEARGPEPVVRVLTWLGSLAAQPGSGSGSRSKWAWQLKDQMKYCGRKVWGCAWSSLALGLHSALFP